MSYEVTAELIPEDQLTEKEKAVVGAKKYLVDGEVLAWYDEDGKFHRDDGEPAVVLPCGQIQYWYHGRIHRPDWKPAITMDDGTQVFFKMSEIHNEEGPAVIRADGTVEFWTGDRMYADFNSFKEKTNLSDSLAVSIRMKYDV